MKAYGLLLVAVGVLVWSTTCAALIALTDLSSLRCVIGANLATVAAFLIMVLLNMVTLFRT